MDNKPPYTRVMKKTWLDGSCFHVFFRYQANKESAIAWDSLYRPETRKLYRIIPEGSMKLAEEAQIRGGYSRFSSLFVQMSGGYASNTSQESMLPLLRFCVNLGGVATCYPNHTYRPDGQWKKNDYLLAWCRAGMFRHKRALEFIWPEDMRDDG